MEAERWKLEDGTNRYGAGEQTANSKQQTANSNQHSAFNTLSFSHFSPLLTLPKQKNKAINFVISNMSSETTRRTKKRPSSDIDDKSSETESSETPLKKLLKTICNDENLHDLTVEANDGSKIGANQIILAGRSKVFWNLFYGDSKEGKKNTSSSPQKVLKVDYSKKVVKFIVEYCYTDNAQIFSEEHKACDCCWARAAVDVASAAGCYGLNKLAQKVHSAACSKMEKDPSLACVFLELSLDGTELQEMAMKVIRNAFHKALLPKGVLSLSSSSLATVVKDSKICAHEFAVFCAIQSWSNGAGNAANRKQHAMHLVAEHIDLNRVTTSDLSGTVYHSGLVPPDKLMEIIHKRNPDKVVNTFRSPVASSPSKNWTFRLLGLSPFVWTTVP